jgi:tetratricopeptide (TPR) repeat protein
MRDLRLGLCSTLMLWLGGTALAQEAADIDVHDGPWDRSVAHERQGDLPGAEAVMVETWGARPDNYYAQLRLAYLALIGKRASIAVARYERARTFSEARSDEDLTTGYAAALALRGWQLAEAGEVRAARGYWQRALAVRPEQASARTGIESAHLAVLEPELWAALVGESVGSESYRGWALFAQLSWRVFDRFSLRLAGRRIDWRQTTAGGSGANVAQTPAGWSVNELYAAAGYQGPSIGAEAMTFKVSSSSDFSLSGVGLASRLGSTWGATLDLVALRSLGRWANQQARVAGWTLLGRHVGVLAGARLTHEPQQRSMSAVLGGWLSGGPVEVYLAGHLGREHWAANLASPSVLSIAVPTRAGGTLTALWNLSQTLRVAGQAELQTLDVGNTTGTFWSASLGLQARIRHL